MNDTRRRRRWGALALAVAAILEIAPARPARAVVGRPLTPVSYAGVARRTTRRAAVATSVAVPAAVPVAARHPVVW